MDKELYKLLAEFLERGGKSNAKELLIDDIITGVAIKLAGEDEPCPYPHTDEPLDGTLTGSWDVERGIMSVYDGAKQLTRMYNLWKANDPVF